MVQERTFLRSLLFGYSLGKLKLKLKPHSNDFKKKIYPKLLTSRISHEY
jgi:hypothetical protein